MKNPNFSYIGSTNSSAKIVKGETIGVDTFVVYLAPSTSSGYQTCPRATSECIKACLNTSGRVIMDKALTIQKARINRTKAFFTDRPNFLRQLWKEIASARKKAMKKGNKFAVRLNGTSDLSPALFTLDGVNILDAFSDVTFYDYTKVLNRSKIAQERTNYDLTFSYSGHNWSECETALSNGIRVAVVFDTKKGKPLPTSYKGFPVIDGDVTDYRPADEGAVIVGLRFKKIKDKVAMAEALKSAFVVNVASL